MKRTAIIASAIASLIIAGCNNEPEETPDITEAIPLDDVEVVDEEGVPATASDDEASGQGATWTGDTDSVERGDNSDQPPIDLENSKLQPAD